MRDKGAIDRRNLHMHSSARLPDDDDLYADEEWEMSETGERCIKPW